MVPVESYSEEYYLDAILHLSTTKKSLWALENKKYTFLVAPFMDKVAIKFTIEECFGIKTRKINTAILPRKKRIMGKSKGFKSKLKKAIVTLGPDDNIEIFSDI